MDFNNNILILVYCVSIISMVHLPKCTKVECYQFKYLNVGYTTITNFP